jgi:hypothetical protein
MQFSNAYLLLLNNGRAFKGRKSQAKGTQWCRASPSRKKKPAEGHATMHFFYID